MFYVYILRLCNGTYYTGYSLDLQGRVKTHLEGNVQQTKNFRPLKLVYYSCFESKKKALDFERYLKTYSGFAFRNKRLVP